MPISLNRLVLDASVNKIPMKFVIFLLRGFKMQGMCAKILAPVFFQEKSSDRCVKINPDTVF
jgi:hypothetical protein